MEDPKADVPGPSNRNQRGNADANAANANAINGFENGSSSVHMFKVRQPTSFPICICT